ncbi:MAG: hypothetical protein A4E59_01020 [Syntrophorhabdus sp. PtaB.Bin027]|nr:MAG: hypothetical protein A4E59_01020 [Syntrophorhabdus sp. PtaB.Bin027]
MRLTAIRTYDFLHKYNYTIPINTTEHITILHGPNGCGKTNLFILIDALFNRKFSTLRQIPFRVVRLFFDNGDELRIFSTFFQMAREYLNDPFYVKFLQMGDIYDFKSIYFEMITQEESNWRRLFQLNENEFKEIIPEEYSNFEKIAIIKDKIKKYALDYKSEKFDTHDLKNLYEKILFSFDNKDAIQHYRGFSSKKDYPEPLKSLIRSLRTEFIQTQRIISYDSQKKKNIEEILQCSKNYGKILAKHQKIIDKKEERFTKKLKKILEPDFLDYNNIPSISNKELDEMLNFYSNYFFPRIHWDLKNPANIEGKYPYFDFNFIKDLGFSIEFIDPVDQRSRMISILFLKHITDIYNSVKDIDEKITFLEDIMEKLSLKSFVTGPYGVEVIHDKDDDIPLPRLSSGEQHLFIIYFTLLFRCRTGSLVLIDEPELSLHIHWQRKFLRNLKQILALNPIDVIIATHSPDIIFDRRDLSVSLRGDK